MADVAGYTCRGCGQHHSELPMHYGAPAPAQWLSIPEPQRGERAALTSDTCVIDGRHFFVVGNLEIPVHGFQERFSWDVWVSLSAESFARARELWDRHGRESEPPYFGWLCTALPGYPDTVALKTHVHTREVGRRPFVELEATTHPLAVEQRAGISLERVQEIAETVRHRSMR